MKRRSRGAAASPGSSGAGVGGVCLCLAHRHHELQVTAVEKHADLAAMAQENAEVNGVANRLRILTTDIRELPPVLRRALPSPEPGTVQGC